MIDIVCKYIDSLLIEKDIVLVCIEGNCASGKSTLAKNIKEIYDCNVFHMDDFFLPPYKRTEKRLSEIGGNIDYERVKKEIIDNILKYDNFSFKPYDCHSQSYMKEVSVVQKKLNIIEGVYSMHPVLMKYYDLKIFLSANLTQQKKRILNRNGHLMYEKFLNEWIPLENRYFKKLNIPEKCDLVF